MGPLRGSSPSPSRGEGGEGVKGQHDAGPEGEFASPACSAHEMDPAYMWAPPPLKARGVKARALNVLRLLRRGRR